MSKPAANSPPRDADTLLSGTKAAVHERAGVLESILRELTLAEPILQAGRLFPLAQAGLLSREDIAANHGPEVAQLVHDVIELPVLNAAGLLPAEGGLSPDQGENLRKMLIAMVRDVRVVLIRLADQLAQLRGLKAAPPERRQAAARVSREIYAPLANRLGIWQLKWELEDLAFRYLEPATYKQIAGWLAERRADRETYIAEVTALLETRLRQERIRAEVRGRPKHIYSIWRKMQRKETAFENLYDLRALRVLVDNIADCYAVLGIVHGLWPHIPREFDDYIANPKENLYQSLHTAVVGPHGKPLEIQIRTHEMDRHAELGVAAHWRYKEGSGTDPALEQKIAWLRQLLEPGDEAAAEQDLIARFKQEIFEDRVYVITPKGRIMDLPAGSTPLDFAYHVHTHVGHRCRGAKVNGRMVQLTQALRNGDQVEILTARDGAPSRDWLIPQLGYLVSPRARAKVKAWFRQQDHEHNSGQGRSLVERELHRLGAGDLKYEELAREFSTAPTLEAFFALVGSGDITTAQLAGAVQRLVGVPAARTPAPLRVSRPGKTARRSDGGIKVRGVGNLLTHIARCCHPVPPDPIIGFITRGRGVTIHRRDCRSLSRTGREQTESRLIDVAWGHADDRTYPVDIAIEAHDYHGLLRDISAVMAATEVNITALQSAVDRSTGIAGIQLTVEIADLEQLSHLLNRLHQLPRIIGARRKGP